MKRICLAAGCCAAAIAGAAGANAQTLNLTSNLSPSHAVASAGIEPFMDCVKTASSGAIDFKYFPSSQIASVSEALDAVNMGLADVGFIAITALPEKFPLNSLSVLPGMGDTVTELVTSYSAVLDGDGPLAQEVRDNRIVPLMTIMFPTYQVMMTGKFDPANASLKGKKINVLGGIQTMIVSSMGGTPIDMPAGDFYMSLERGVSDGVILSYPSADSYSLDEVVKSISNNVSLGSAAALLSISLEDWEQFSEDKQKILLDCGRQQESVLAAHLDETDGQLKQQFAASGVESFAFPDDVRAEIMAGAQQVVNDYIERLEFRGLPGKEAYESYRAVIDQ
ncbi:TRAP transporter substrate-binding protein DctP [Paracoccus sp. (in: a-proteobacteria)]|uniref:TRAP transporter substrate-binding protein n=1 Tax=Paracoccus sp. TaxID=267 RepID=UPI002AFE3E2B|nr:TRAP transporter substrate-binding protein DctP [Paracoccus sp. (in: a-proteobacteria)]